MPSMMPPKPPVRSSMPSMRAMASSGVPTSSAPAISASSMVFALPPIISPRPGTFASPKYARFG